ncbi:MAG TPA: hypothetical protein VLH18_04495, partial [Candidatus Limnocylindrales bacterium]|nr:hypothetical protein [Candidatus Limnocylindrales bacterium]
ITKEFSGHVSECFIDDVPVKSSEYADKIASICDEETFKLLTSPTYFNTELHWKKRREVLLQVCGDVSDGDVIASSKELAELPKILGDRSIDDHRKVIAASRKKINDELQKIPVRIDEAERGLPDVSGLDKKKLVEVKDGLVVNLDLKLTEITRIKSGGEVAEKTKQLRELEGQLLDIKNKHRAEVDKQVGEKRKELSHAEDVLASIEQQRRATIRTLESNEDYVKQYEVEAAKLRDQWREVNGREFTFEQEEACPSCGQALPAEKLEKAREKALAAFNREKAGLLEEISTKGKKRKADIEVVKAEIEENRTAIAELKNAFNSEWSTLNKIQNEIDAITASATDPTASPEYKKALAAKQKLDSEISALQTGTNELLIMAQEEADTIREQIQAVDDDLQKLRMREQGEARIKELAAEEKKLAAEFERLEKELFLTEQFTRAKVNLLEEKINSKFKHARFRLFSEQINGGLMETCDTLFAGVPYGSGLNNAARINVGLDIINTLSEFYQFTAPIVIDNAESVTKIIETIGQQIKLVVSEEDKKLRVEIEPSIIEGV